MPPNTHLDHDTLRELQSVLGSDFPVLVRTYLADSETRVAAMRRAAAATDAAALRDAAHSLKGSSLNIGAGSLAGLCLDIEQAARAGELDRARSLLDAVENEYRAVARTLGAS
ncbi:MAG: Hpt domain-containing protein [Pseudomonadota bacterium]